MEGKYRVELEELFEDHLRVVHRVRDFCALDQAEGSIQSCQPEVAEELEGISEETHDRPVLEYSLKDQI